MNRKYSACFRVEFFFLLFPESTVTVKETYCSVANLVPNTQYEFWVTAQNRAGLSPASECAVYMTGTEALVPSRHTGVTASLVWAILISFGWAGVVVYFFSFYLIHQICMPDTERHFLVVSLKRPKSTAARSHRAS